MYDEIEMEFYTLKLLGLTRRLPVKKLGIRLKIASFNLLGDTELVEKVALELAERIKYFDFDFFVGPEVKILPLIYELSSIFNHKQYVIARKKITGYMTNPLKIEGKRGLVLNGPDAELLKNKTVILVNDVVSTGKTVKNLEKLVKMASGEVGAVVSILKQGELQEKISQPFFYLAEIPLIYQNSFSS